MRINYLFSGLDKEKGFTSEQAECLREDIKENSNIVFIASLFKDHEKTEFNTKRILNMFKNIDINFKEVNIIDNTVSYDDTKEIIRKSDIVFLLGGSPTNQMKSINEYGIKEDLCKKDFILGVSAGSMNQTKRVIYEGEFEDEMPIENYKGLGFFDTVIYPHLELDNQKYMEELYRVSKITKVIALPNPSFIRIKNKNIEFIGDYYIVENERLEKGNFGKISKVRER